MKFAVVCAVLVVLVAGLAESNEQPQGNLLNILGGAQFVKENAAGFAPGHEGHFHGTSNQKASCKGRSTTTTAATTAAG